MRFFENLDQVPTDRLRIFENLDQVPTDHLRIFEDGTSDPTLGHAQAAAPLTTAEREAIVGFELALTCAQTFTFFIGSLNSAGANGGPELLASAQPPTSTEEAA